MKVKLKAVAVAVLVLALQLFSAFIPCMAAAAGETSTEQKVVSFSNTTIYADLVDPGIYGEGRTPGEISAGETAAAATLLQKYPKDASKGTGDVQIVSSVLQENASGYSAFFYVYIPGGTVSALSATFTLDAGGRKLYKSAKQLDDTATLIKYRVPLTKAEYLACKVGESYELTVSLFEITYSTSGSTSSGTKKVTYKPITNQVVGGELSSDLMITYSASGSAIKWNVSDSLKLDVHFASDRFSTEKTVSDGLYTQLNTAMFLIPEKYFDDFGLIDAIKYQYELFERVPMLVSESADLVSAAGTKYTAAKLKAMLWDAANSMTVPGKIELNPTKYGYVGEADYQVIFGGSRWYVKPQYDNFNSFAFCKPMKEVDKFIVSRSELLASYRAAKAAYDDYVDLFGSVNDSSSLRFRGYTPLTFAEYLGAGSHTELKEYVRFVDEIIKNESYDSAVPWWEKILGGGGLFTSWEDDSVSVNAIQTITLDELQALADEHGTSLDEYLAKTYAIDETDVETMKKLLYSLEGHSGRLVLFHFLETAYVGFNVEGFSTNGDDDIVPDSAVEKTFYVQNAIIDQFKILSIYFKDADRITEVPTVMESMTFIEGIESPDDLEDEKSTTPGEFFKDAGANVWDAIQKLLNVIRAIVFVLVFLVITIVVLRLIALVRDAFGRRGGGR